jgi:uncharacterized damage-inducible protein DinB
MRTDDIRFLFGFDRWATERVLTALDGIPEDVWTAGETVGERRLGTIMIHHLGASQRWRHAIQQDDEAPRPEDEPLLSVAELRARWTAEWSAVDAWLSTLDDAFLASVREGSAIWQMLAHVVNHGTQHRSEAATLMTDAGYSPGDLDMIDYVESPAVAACDPTAPSIVDGEPG